MVKLPEISLRNTPVSKGVLSTAFTLAAADCGAFFWSEQDKLDGALCSSCGRPLREELPSQTRRLMKPKGKAKRFSNWGYTFDGQLVVSRLALEFLSKRSVEFDYLELEVPANYFALRFSKLYEFDYSGRGTRFEEKCKTCGGFASVAGAFPAYVKDGFQIGSQDVMRSDILFGYGAEQSPVVIVGVEIKAELQKTFPELEFGEVRRIK